MMIVPAGVKVHLALGYTDMRKGIDALAAGFELLAAMAASCSPPVGLVRGLSFMKSRKPPGSPVAAEALRRIGELYAVESRVRGQSPADRLAERRSFSQPIVESLRPWLEAQLSRIPGRSTLAEAIRYALSRWEL